MIKTETKVNKFQGSELTKCNLASQGKFKMAILALVLLLFTNITSAQTTTEDKVNEIKTEQEKPKEEEVKDSNPKDTDRGVTPVIVILPKQKDKKENGI